MTDDRGSPMGSDFANAVLIARHRSGKSASPCGSVHRQCMWSGRTTQASIWKGARPRTCRTASRSASMRATSKFDRRSSKFTVKKEERSTRNPIAAIVRHVGSTPDLRYRQNALRCSALRLLFGKSALIPEIRSKIDPTNWPIRSRHLVFLRWTSPNVENAARPQGPAFLQIAAAYSASGKRMMNPSRFGIFTLGKVSAFIVSLSPMSLFSARI